MLVLDKTSSPTEAAIGKWIAVLYGTGAVTLTAGYLIYCIALNVQLVYKCKRAYKMQMKEIVEPSSSNAASLAATLKFEIVVPAAEMAAAIRAFADHVGWEHLDYDRFMRFLFHRHRPASVASHEDEINCRFAPVTRERSRVFYEKFVAERLEAEFEANHPSQ